MESGVTYCDIRFSEKIQVFSKKYLMCFDYIVDVEEPRHAFTKQLFSKLISTSQVLEDFLDFHGAKNNKEWFFYRELTAAVRHLSLAGYSQKHIINRLVHYNLQADGFEQDGQKTIDFITQCLMKLAPVILEEAQRLKIEIPRDRYTSQDFPGIVTGEMLENNIDNEEKKDQRKNLVKLASDFLTIVRHFDTFGVYGPIGIEDIVNMVPEKINEVEIRRHEMTVHNLQSYFDSYVMHGGLNFRNQKLNQFRSYFSVVFHLLQHMGRLLHFYERHLYQPSSKSIYERIQKRLAHLIDPEMLLDRTINYGLFYVCHFLNTGKELALDILNENIERSRIQVPVPLKRGFHSRPSLLVAKIVQHYGGQVELVIGEDRFDASSVLDLQWAGGKIQNENITEVVFEGDARALKDIEVIAGVNYCEDVMGKGRPIPKELKYLK